MYQNVRPEKMQLCIEPRGVITGAQVYALHGDSKYKVRRPIEFGNLAVSRHYTKTEVVQDLTLILVQALRENIKMERSVYNKFGVVLVVGPQMPKWQVRTLVDMICDLGFK